MISQSLELSLVQIYLITKLIEKMGLLEGFKTIIATISEIVSILYLGNSSAGVKILLRNPQ